MKSTAACFLWSGLWLLATLSVPPPLWAAERLRVGVADFPFARFNPWASPNQPGVFILSAVFDGLTRVGPDGTTQAWLATSWSSEDSTTWQIDLREDVIFSSGRPFTSRDVQQSLNYLTGPVTRREVIAQNFANVRTVNVSGLHSLRITLDAPDVLFPRTISQLLIPDWTAWEKLGPDEFALNPIGTGPFSVESVSGDRIQFIAHKKSWRAPKEKKMEFIALSEPSSRLNGLLSNRLDIAFAMSPDDLAILEQARVSLYAADLPIVYGLIFIVNKQGSPIQSKLVRQALNYAVDVEEIIDVALAGYSNAASQPTHHRTLGFDPALKPYGHDPEKAKALLAEADFPQGFSLVAEVTLSGPIEALVLQKIADDLKRIGVDLTLETITYASFASNFRTGNWSGDAFNMTFSAEPNLDALRSIRYHSCDWTARWYCDESIMPTIHRAAHEPSLDERQRLTRHVMAHYREEAPAIFLYEMPHFFALSDKVQGFSTIHSFIPWHNVSVSNR